MRKTVIALVLTMFAGPCFAQNCYQFGNTVNCSNGLSAHQFGNTTQFSDGVSAHQFGNTTTFSNGLNAQQFGNTTTYSDGERRTNSATRRSSATAGYVTNLGI